MPVKMPAVIGQYTGKCCESDIFNNNDMNLSEELFDKLFASEDFKRAMKNRYYIGFLGHPEDPNCMDFRNACIVMTDCHKEGKDIIGTFDLIDTPVGQIVKTFKDAGVNFGISIRGAGDVDPQGYVDPDTFIFRGFDLVTFPAYDDCVPEFQAIAASSDPAKQQAKKKIVAAIDSNLKKIDSATTLNELQKQFKVDSSEFKKIENRKLSINKVSASEEIEFLKQQVKGMTDLYMETAEENRQLKSKVNKYIKKCKSVEAKSNKYVAAMKKIAQDQLSNANDEIDNLTSKYNAAIKANCSLKNELDDINSDNLKYQRKITSSTDTAEEYKAKYMQAQNKLSETVTASSKLRKEISNRDTKIQKLEERIAACEEILGQYQEAYANMYANALGVCLENLPISASTSVSEMRQMISGSTNTSNIASLNNTEESFEDKDLILDNDSEDDLVTM